jgi:hypothetical protein
MDQDQLRNALSSRTGLREAFEAARGHTDDQLMALSLEVAQEPLQPSVDEALVRYWIEAARLQPHLGEQLIERLVQQLSADPNGRAPALLAALAGGAWTELSGQDSRVALGSRTDGIVAVVQRLVDEVERHGWSPEAEDAIRNCLAYVVAWPIPVAAVAPLRAQMIRAIRLGVCPADELPGTLAPRRVASRVQILVDALRASIRRPDPRWQRLICVTGWTILSAPVERADDIATAFEKEALAEVELARLLGAITDVEAWHRDPSLLRGPTTETVLRRLLRPNRKGPGQRRLLQILGIMGYAVEQPQRDRMPDELPTSVAGALELARQLGVARVHLPLGPPVPASDVHGLPAALASFYIEYDGLGELIVPLHERPELIAAWEQTITDRQELGLAAMTLDGERLASEYFLPFGVDVDGFLFLLGPASQVLRYDPLSGQCSEEHASLGSFLTEQVVEAWKRREGRDG